MNSTLMYFSSLAAALAVGFTVAWYLKHHLRGILVDLCGTENRADFWMAFSNVVLILMPIVFVMQFSAERDGSLSPALQFNGQLKWVFIGSVVSVMSLGAILALFIPRDTGRAKKTP